MIRSATLYAQLVALSVALGLLLGGVIGWAAYWFTAWLVGLVSWAMIARTNRDLLQVVADYEAMTAEIVGSFQAAVRCAGCHRGAVLASGAEAHGRIMAGQNVPLPAGWSMSHGRPYCGDCIPPKDGGS